MEGLLCALRPAYLLRLVAAAHVTRDSSSRARLYTPPERHAQTGPGNASLLPPAPAALRLDVHSLAASGAQRSPQWRRGPEGRALAPCSSEPHRAGRGSVPPSWAQRLCPRTHWAARSRATFCREGVKNDRDSQELVDRGWEGHAVGGGGLLSPHSLPPSARGSGWGAPAREYGFVPTDRRWQAPALMSEDCCRSPAPGAGRGGIKGGAH